MREATERIVDEANDKHTTLVKTKHNLREGSNIQFREQRESNEAVNRKAKSTHTAPLVLVNKGIKGKPKVSPYHKVLCFSLHSH